MPLQIPDLGQRTLLPTPACPACQGVLALETRLVSKPLGTFSLAGVQMKTSASPRVFLLCTNCGVESEQKD